MNTITYPFVEGKMSLPLDSIIYIETFGHKNLFHTKSNTYSLYKKLGEIEEELKDEGFLRIHMSVIRQIKYCLIMQIETDFLGYAEAV